MRIGFGLPLPEQIVALREYIVKSNIMLEEAGIFF